MRGMVRELRYVSGKQDKQDSCARGLASLLGDKTIETVVTSRQHPPGHKTSKTHKTSETSKTSKTKQAIHQDAVAVSVIESYSKFSFVCTAVTCRWRAVSALAVFSNVTIYAQQLSVLNWGTIDLVTIFAAVCTYDIPWNEHHDNARLVVCIHRCQDGVCMPASLSRPNCALSLRSTA